MKRNIIELMIETVKNELSDEEITSVQRDIAQVASSLVTDADGGIQELAWVLMDAAMNGLGSPFLVILKDFGTRAEVIAKLHAKYQQQKQTSSDIKTITSAAPVPVVSSAKVDVVAKKVSPAGTAGDNTNTTDSAPPSFLHIPVEGFDVKALFSFIADLPSVTSLQFVNATTYMPPTALMLRSETELMAMLDRMAVDLMDDEDWQRRSQALITLENLAWGSLWDMVSPATFTRKLQDALDLQMGDLRSLIIKQACKALSIMAYQWKQRTLQNPANYPASGLTVLIELLWPKITKLLVSKTQIIAHSADALVRMLLLSCEDAKVLPLLHELMRSKSGMLHKCGLEYLLFCVTRWSGDVLERNAALIQSSIKIGLSGATAEARKVARCVYRWYHHMATVRHAPAHFGHLHRRLEGELEATVLKQVQMEDKSTLTVEMMQFLRELPVSLKYIVDTGDASEVTPPAAIVDAIVEDPAHLAGAASATFFDDDNFDWMGAATNDEVAPTTTKKAATTRMSVLGGGAVRPNFAAVPVSSSANATAMPASTASASTASSGMLMMGGARRMSISGGMPLRLGAGGAGLDSTAPGGSSSIMATGARRMSIAPVQRMALAAMDDEPIEAPLTASALPPAPTVEVSALPVAAAPVNRRASLAVAPPPPPTSSAAPAANGSVGLREGPKRVLQPLPSASVNSNAMATSQPPVAALAVSEENQDPQDYDAKFAAFKAKKSAMATTSHAPVTAAVEKKAQTIVEVFKATLAAATASGSAAALSQHKLKAIESYAQNLKALVAGGSGDAQTMTMREDVVSLGWSFVLDATADANSKVYTEAVKAVEGFFQHPSLSAKFLVEAAQGVSEMKASPLSTLLVKMFTSLVDAKPAAREAISRISSEVRAQIPSDLLLKTLSFRLKDLPERALAASFQFAGALLPTATAAEALWEPFRQAPFVQDVVYRAMNCLVPGSASEASVGGGDSSSGEAKKPSPVAMLAGKRFLAKFYETVATANGESAATSVTSTFFKVVASMSIAQQTTLKTLLVSAISAQQFDLRLAQQIKRDKAQLVKKTAAVATAPAAPLAAIAAQLTSKATFAPAPVLPVDTEPRISRANSSNELLQQKVELLEAVVQQVCRSPTVLASATNSKASSPTAAAAQQAAVIAQTSPAAVSKVASPVAATVAAAASPNAAVSPAADIIAQVVSSGRMLSPLAMVTSPMPTVAAHGVDDAAAGHEKAANVLTLLRSVTKTASPVSADSSAPAVASPTVVNGRLFPDDEDAAHAAIAEACESASVEAPAPVVRDFAWAKAEMLGLGSPSPADDGNDDASSARFVAVVSTVKSLIRRTSHAGGVGSPMKDALSAVQCLELIFLVLDVYPLYVVSADSDVVQMTRSLLLSLVHVGQGHFSREMVHAVVSKVYGLFGSFAALLSSSPSEAAATTQQLRDYESILIDVVVELFAAATSHEDVVVHAQYVASQLAAVETASTPMHLRVLSMKAWSTLIAQATSLTSAADVNEEDWDAQWRRTVAWVLAQGLAHPVTLVRQQATLCLAQIFLFYHSPPRPGYEAGAVRKERREQCLQWLTPLTVVQRKLLMVYVEKFRHQQQQQLRV